MSTNNKDYNIGAKIAKQISNIQDNMTMNDNIHLNKPKANSDKPCCPYCRSENIDTVSDITAGKGGHIAYYCNNCNGYFITPQFNTINQHQIKTYTTEEERDKDYVSEAPKEDIDRIGSTVCELMAEKGFTRINQALDFLAKHYQETKDIIPQKKKQRTSPGKMTIDDVEKYIKISESTKSQRLFTTYAAITITYVRAFTDTMDSIDTVSFNCSDIDDLKKQWDKFRSSKNLQEDCIASFYTDVSMWDKAYVDDLNKALTGFIEAIYVDDDDRNIFFEEDRKEILKIILDHINFKADGKIIYPHVETTRDPDTGRMVQTVKRYWGE